MSAETHTPTTHQIPATTPEPTDKPKTTRAPKAKAPRLVPLGPTLVAGGLLILIAELMLFQVRPIWIPIAVNVLAIGATLTVWVLRKRKARRSNRAGRPASKKTGGFLAGLAALRAAGRTKGGTRSAGGRSAGLGGGRGGILGKLTGGRLGTKPKGGTAGSTPRRSRNPLSKANRSARSAKKAEKRARSGGSRNPLTKAGRANRAASKKAGGGSRNPFSKANQPGRAAKKAGRDTGGARKTGGGGSTPKGGRNPFSKANRVAKKAKKAGRGTGGSGSGASTPKAPGSKPSKRSGWEDTKKAFLKGLRGDEKETPAPHSAPKAIEPVTDKPDEAKQETASKSTKREPVKVPAPPYEASHTNKEGKTMGLFDFNDRSLYGFGEGLKQVPTEIEEMRQRYEAMAAAAEDEQPINNGVAEGLRAIANMLRSCEDVGSALHPTFRQQNEADIERVENPRKGNSAIEARADVQSAQRDA